MSGAGEAERRAAARLGISPEALEELAQAAWRRSFVEERERRAAGERSHAAKGQVSRQLLAELGLAARPQPVRHPLAPEDEALLERFLATPQQMRLSAVYRRSTTSSLRSLGRVLDGRPLLSATRHDVEGWLRLLSRKTRQSYLSPARAFYRWAWDTRRIAVDPTAGLHEGRQRRPPSSRTISIFPKAAQGTVGCLAYRYINERQARGELRPLGARATHYTLIPFAEHVGRDLTADRLTRRHIERWLERSDLAASTRRTQLSQVRHFCQWLVKEGYLRRDPTADIRSPRNPRVLPRGLTAEQVGRALEKAPDARMAAIIALMVQEGLRACEVVGLEVADVDLRESLLVVRQGKGGHERLLPLSDETRDYLLRYLDEHPASRGPLIRSYHEKTQPISSKYLSRVVSEALHSAGVSESGHSLRHTMAGDMLRRGAHLRDVQAALGHSSIQSTERYLPLLVGELREAMGGRQYRGSSAIEAEPKP